MTKEEKAKILDEFIDIHKCIDALHDVIGDIDQMLFNIASEYSDQEDSVCVCSCQECEIYGECPDADDNILGDAFGEYSDIHIGDKVAICDLTGVLEYAGDWVFENVKDKNAAMQYAYGEKPEQTVMVVAEDEDSYIGATDKEYTVITLDENKGAAYVRDESTKKCYVVGMSALAKKIPEELCREFENMINSAD